MSRPVSVCFSFPFSKTLAAVSKTIQLLEVSRNLLPFLSNLTQSEQLESCCHESLSLECSLSLSLSLVKSHTRTHTCLSLALPLSMFLPLKPFKSNSFQLKVHLVIFSAFMTSFFLKVAQVVKFYFGLLFK